MRQPADRRQRLVLLVLTALAVLTAGPALAVDVITDGDMEAAGIAAWPHTDLVGSNASAKATDRSAAGQSLKGSSQAGRRVNVEWYNSQTVGVVNSGDTVLLSLWWCGQFSHTGGGNNATLSFEIKPASSAFWTSVWSVTLDPTLTTFQTGTAGNVDVSASFSTSESYDIRLHVVGMTGNNTAAVLNTWFDNVVLDVSAPAATNTVGNGSDPASTGVCPGGGAAELDAFTLQTSSGSDTVTAVELSLAAGTAARLALVEITDDAGATVYGSVSNPATDTVSISLSTSITVTTTVTQYKVRITPRGHAGMPAPPGAAYPVTGTVTAVSCSNTTSYNDSASATVTIDNASPANAAWVTITPGDSQIGLSWSNPADADFSAVLILRSTATISDAPAEGDSSYLAGSPIGAGTVVYVGSGTSFNDTGVTNGTDYWYKIFARDICVNYALGAEDGPYRPIPNAVTTGVPSAVVDSCSQITVSAPFSDDGNGDSTTTFERKTGTNCGGGGYATVAGCVGLGGASPRTCVDTTVAASSDYCYQITFSDADGVNGSNPQAIGSFATPACSGVITVGNGTDPGNASRCPGDGAADLDAFTLVADSGSDTVTAVELSLAAGTAAGLSLVEITDDAGATVYGSVSNPASDTLSITLSATIDVTTSAVQYKLRITPKSHAAMPAPPGTSYSVSGTVSNLTATYSVTDNDSGSATVTIDNQSPADATWSTVTPGDGQIDLSWSNPGDTDFAEVVILRATAAISDAPVEGSTYSAGNPIGAATVVYAGSGTGFLDTGVVNGTDYWYKLFARDTCVNYAAGVAGGPWTPGAAATTTVGNGSDPANTTLCPGAAATALDAFTLQTSTGSDTVTAVEVRVTGASAYLSLVEVTDDGGGTVYGSQATPVADTMTISLSPSIGATTSAVQYKIRITPKAHADMPAPPGSELTITGTVSDLTCSNTSVLSDTGSAGHTIDNKAPADATWGAVTPGNNQVSLAWSNPGDADFTEVVILRNTFIITDTPVEGTTYIAGNTIGSSSVVYAGSGTATTDSGVVNGNGYHYQIFARDTCGNYSPGIETGPHVPSPAAADATTVGSRVVTASSCTQLVVSCYLSGDDNGNGYTTVEYNDGGMQTACAALTGPSPRMCIIPQLAESTAYSITVTYTDSDGVSGTNPDTFNGTTLACAGDSAPPTITLLAPARESVIGGTDRIKVQLYDPDGLGAAPLELAVDGGGFSGGASLNAAYDCGTDCWVYEIDLDTTAYGNGLHSLSLRSTDSQGNVARSELPVRISNLGTEAGGSGTLLRRTHGSQLCIDCHSIATHSSQATSFKYGSWSVDCLVCHTPHRTRNVFLVREQLTTPSSGEMSVLFHLDDNPDDGGGDTNPGSAPGNYSFLGDRSQTAGGQPNAPHDDGICEVCHTRTKYWVNTPTAGKHEHNENVRCLKCHSHANGFSGGGGGCTGCHGNAGDSGTTGPNTRRPVNADFANTTGGGEPRSHHVGNAGATMGGQLTDFDCVVCHAEGRVNGADVETVATWHGNDGGTTTIDLKDADTWNDADPTNPAAVYTYDPDAIDSDVSGGGGDAADWNSANAVWRVQTSTELDPFCLTCHDSNGAVTSYNATDGGSAGNPFGDTLISNEYDQMNRGSVVNIKGMVTDGGSDLDGDGTTDPPNGAYARHAIRGQSTSRYSSDTLSGADQSMYQFGGLTNLGTDELGKTVWNDTSVMGCADCHTTDGANTTAGNAHGSDSEYLLKDASGYATEGTLAGNSYVCFRCHVLGVYDVGVGHTSNASDYQSSTAAVGANRLTDTSKSMGSMFGFSCMNCHGGAPGNVGSLQSPTTPESTAAGFGRIHGTSSVFTNGAGGTRKAYRFMNGGGVRFYDPGGWSGTSITCYTIGSADSWSACTKHSGGTGWTKPLQRPRDY